MECAGLCHLWPEGHHRRDLPRLAHSLHRPARQARAQARRNRCGGDRHRQPLQRSRLDHRHAVQRLRHDVHRQRAKSAERLALLAGHGDRLSYYYRRADRAPAEQRAPEGLTVPPAVPASSCLVGSGMSPDIRARSSSSTGMTECRTPRPATRITLLHASPRFRWPE